MAHLLGIWTPHSLMIQTQQACLESQWGRRSVCVKTDLFEAESDFFRGLNIVAIWECECRVTLLCDLVTESCTFMQKRNYFRQPQESLEWSGIKPVIFGYNCSPNCTIKRCDRTVIWPFLISKGEEVWILSWAGSRAEPDTGAPLGTTSLVVSKN